MEVNTQEIMEASQQQGVNGNLFLLHVATPGGAPKDIHRKIIKPFLEQHGWKKVSYQYSGFRALYFCHNKSDGQERAEAIRDRSELKDKLEEYNKNLNVGSFHVHIVLSVPVNYNEDVIELTSNPEFIED